MTTATNISSLDVITDGYLKQKNITHKIANNIYNQQIDNSQFDLFHNDLIELSKSATSVMAKERDINPVQKTPPNPFKSQNSRWHIISDIAKNLASFCKKIDEAIKIPIQGLDAQWRKHTMDDLPDSPWGLVGDILIEEGLDRIEQAREERNRNYREDL